MGLQGDEMLEPDDGEAHAAERHAEAEGAWLGRTPDCSGACSRTTARRWLRVGAWRRPSPTSRPRAPDGLETWIEDRFRRHAGNAGVVRPELVAEKASR